ncbi:MAG: hemin uptake protein HemP [Betaproteobacteria bacterium]
MIMILIDVVNPANDNPPMSPAVPPLPAALPGAADSLTTPVQGAIATARPARVDSATLLGRARELAILHGGREYRLRVTQNGKLILTA